MLLLDCTNLAQLLLLLTGQRGRVGDKCSIWLLLLLHFCPALFHVAALQLFCTFFGALFRNLAQALISRGWMGRGGLRGCGWAVKC